MNGTSPGLTETLVLPEAEIDSYSTAPVTSPGTPRGVRGGSILTGPSKGIRSTPNTGSVMTNSEDSGADIR
jgi:hypothetical protein